MRLPCNLVHLFQTAIVNVTEVVSLNNEYRRQILIEQLKELLSSSPNMAISLSNLLKQYRETFNVNLDICLYGFNNIVELKAHLAGFIEVS